MGLSVWLLISSLNKLLQVRVLRSSHKTSLVQKGRHRLLECRFKSSVLSPSLPASVPPEQASATIRKGGGHTNVLVKGHCIFNSPPEDSLGDCPPEGSWGLGQYSNASCKIYLRINKTSQSVRRVMELVCFHLWSF